MTSAQQAGALIDSFADALNRRDAAALTSLFTDDADFVDFMGHWLRGRDAIRDGHTRAFAGLLGAGTMLWRDVVVNAFGADAFVGHGLWTIPAHEHVDGSPLSERHGVITFLLTSTPDGLRIRAGQNTEQR